MKKPFLIVSILAILLSACGTSVTAPVITATPAITATSAFTSTPELTATPEASPTPDFSKPTAVIASNKAEFWFPLPEQEWDWFVEYCNPCFPSAARPPVERMWRVLLELDKTYDVEVSCYSDLSQSPQKGNTSEMLTACSGKILEVTKFYDGSHIETAQTSFSGLTFSYDDGRLIMELTDPTLTQMLYDKQPTFLKFYSRLMSSYSDPESRGYKDESYNAILVFE